MQYQLLLERQALMDDRVPSWNKSSQEYARSSDQYKDAARPFAVQAKKNAKEASSIAKDNKRLRREIIRIQKLMQDFHKQRLEHFVYDSSLWSTDLERALGELSDHWSHHSSHLFADVWDACVNKYGKDFDTEKKATVDELNDAWEQALRH